jgi:hypothetical protein
VVIPRISPAALDDAAGAGTPLHGARARLRAVPPRPLLTLTLLAADPASVQLDGLPVEVSRGHLELLALLAVRPEGMSSEELAADLYGDAGGPGAVRVQVCRLRKRLGRWIETSPYRLALDVETDVGRVCALLEQGAVRDAAERYHAPMLPRSEAPGVIRAREALEGWLRHAVMTTDDPEALWAWVRSRSGRDDLRAWTRLLANLRHRDQRRGLAAERVGALRAAYGLTADSASLP